MKIHSAGCKAGMFLTFNPDANALISSVVKSIFTWFGDQFQLSYH